MSKILLINPPETMCALPPLGLLYIAAVLERENIDVKVVDSGIEKHSWKDVERVIENENPELVGIPTNTPGITKSMKVAEIVKKIDPKIKVVFGGPHATILPEECLKNQNVDFVVRGEGEFVFVDLVKYVLGYRIKLRDIMNLSFKLNGQIVHHPQTQMIRDLDSLPLPARHFVPIKKYPGVVLPRKHPETQVMATRGCPFKCVFCSRAVFGSTFRARDPIKVVDEIEYLVDTYRIRTINFYDDGLNYNPEWVIKMCDEMISRGLNEEIEWKAQVRVNKPFVTEEMLKKMRESGCWLLCWGIESGDVNMLKRIKKAITLDDVKRAIKMSSDVGIKNLGYFMAGNLGETVETVERTIDFALGLSEYGLDYPQLTLAVPYPGTEFYNVAKNNGWIIAEDWGDYQMDKRSIIIKMPGLPDKYLENAISRFYKKFYFRPSYLIKQLKKIKSLDDLFLIGIGLRYILKAFMERIPYATELD